MDQPNFRSYLIPALEREFEGWEITFDIPPKPIATFSEKQAEVGKVLVYDDGFEVTIVIEKISHGHFELYEAKVSPEEEARIVSEDVIDFLKALFADRVLLHVRPDGRGGGWERLDLNDGPPQLDPSYRYYLWSRPFLPNAR